METSICFRPLTGIVPDIQLKKYMERRYRPLMGMVHRKDGTYDGNVSYRPLAGIVPSGLTMAFCVVCFRPLTGIVLLPRM